MNNHDVLVREQEAYKDLPIVSSITHQEIFNNYLQIKRDIQMILQTEMERMLDTPELMDLIISKTG